MTLNSRLRQLERIIGKRSTPTDSLPMGKRLLSAIPTWQLKVLAEAQQGRHGEDGARIPQLFALIIAILESHVQSSALPGDAQILEMLCQAAVKSSELRAAVHELRELLRLYRDPSRSCCSPGSEVDPLRVVE